MNETELKIKNFSDDWQGRGYEKGDTQKFWLTLLRKVLGVEEPEKIIDFEKQVKVDDQTKFIDGYIARTKILIEQKKYGEDLSKSAFEQGEIYADNLPYSERPRWIITCNFDEFRIYDLVEMRSLEYISGAEVYRPTTFKLAELRYFYPRLKFIVDPNVIDVKPEIKLSKDAADILKIIYEAFKKNYERAQVANYKNFLDKLCTRLVFCFYASYAQILDNNQFFGYLQSFGDKARQLEALQKIFEVLNTPDNLRGNLDDDLKKFPYVNGGLFDEEIPLPAFNKSLGSPTGAIFAANNAEILNWRKIDPPIFGAMFESILNDDTRRTGGMYYTSTQNIHKVIDPLFLDDLYADFIAAKNKHLKNRAAALLALQDKISKLVFFDPACGSGNFLTETYISLRRLENLILKELRGLKVALPDNPVKVSINQFYGIEIHDFAVAVAQTALWIAENQMLQETEGSLGINLQALPLKNYATIICANALQIDWGKIVRLQDCKIESTDHLANYQSCHLNYIIGNPPFRGYSEQTADQKADLRRVYSDNRKAGKLDYVSGWYRKAVDFIHGTDIRCAFVSTNSIVQGEQCADVWKILYDKFNVHVDFAHRTFKWLSDSDNLAQVHCVVVGFSTAPNLKPKKIFDGDKISVVDNINFYLTDGEIIFVEAHAEHIQDGVPKMYEGSKPADDGNLIIETDDLDYFLQREPAAQKYIRPLIGAAEFIKGKKRYCLWLEGVPMSEIKKMPLVAERVEACRQFRLQSKKAVTRADAETPHLFQEIRQPTTNYILIPVTSSERRQYIPIDFLPANIIATNSVHVIPSAQIYHFGILTSSISMAWMRAVGSRMKSDYRYSANTVYNNFVWCSPTSRQRRRIEQTAQEILNVRADFPAWTFAKLYDENTMPRDLRDAHKENDLAVALAYGFESFFEDEARVVAELMKLYKALTS